MKKTCFHHVSFTVLDERLARRVNGMRSHGMLPELEAFHSEFGERCLQEDGKWVVSCKCDILQSAKSVGVCFFSSSNLCTVGVIGLVFESVVLQVWSTAVAYVLCCTDNLWISYVSAGKFVACDRHLFGVIFSTWLKCMPCHAVLIFSPTNGRELYIPCAS